MKPNYWEWFWITIGAKVNYYPYRGGRALENEGAEEQYKFYIAIMMAGALIGITIYCWISFIYIEPKDLLYVPGFFVSAVCFFALGYVPYKKFSKYREIAVEPEYGLSLTFYTGIRLDRIILGCIQQQFWESC